MRDIVPTAVRGIREALCRQHGCAHALDYSDPCIACPDGHFGRYSSRGCNEEPALPSLLTRAANLTQAVARDVAAGMPRRTGEEIAAIMAACRACQFWRESDGSCAQCGCPLKRKAPMAMENCPIGKW